MKTVKLRCGGCGSDQARVLVEVDDDYSNRGEFRAVVLHCVTCKSKTRLMQTSGIVVDDTVDSDGTFTVY